MDFHSFYSVGCDCYGNCYIWSNVARGEAVRVQTKNPNFYTGSGPNGISMSPNGQVMGVSMSNPQSGWFGGKGLIYSLTEIEIEKKRKKKECRIS